MATKKPLMHRNEPWQPPPGYKKKFDPSSRTRLPPNEDISVSYFQLFQFSTTFDKILIFVSLLFSTIGSIGLPFSVIFYGEFTTLLVDRSLANRTTAPTLVLWWFGGGEVLSNPTAEENKNALINDSKAFAIGSVTVGTIQLISLAISVYLINNTALSQVGRMREMFFHAILRQDMSWYDTTKDKNFATKMNDNLEKIKEGIGEKLAIFIHIIMTFIVVVIFSLIFAWKLSLAVLSSVPVILFSTAMVARMQTTLTTTELRAYSLAGSVAEEVLTNIRTVVAFSGEEKEFERYSEKLRPAEKIGIKKGLYSAIGSGLIWLIGYCTDALTLWYGVKLILEDRAQGAKGYTSAYLIMVMLGIQSAAEYLGFTSPFVETFAVARGAARTIFSVITREPLIDSLGEEGLAPDEMEGNIEFKNVYFQYPSREEVRILQGINLEIKAGQNVALVGPSGCGKTTCLQLVQRQYDPAVGSVNIDGNNISELNTKWLRSRIGVVGQEPVLFATTVGENIRYGRPDATQKEIEDAAKIANCHEFIIKLPDGYDTMVGEQGAQMSGGQKQRIAIARAIVRNPKILLLDEATSALDSASEKKVQEALEKASKGRTTLIVSHRLSAITTADKIIFLQNGVAQEEGTHSELMEKKGLYHDLVMASHPGKIGKSVRKEREQKRKASQVFEEPEFPGSEVTVVSIEVEDDLYPVSIHRLLKLNSPEWKYLVIGLIGCIIHGLSLPAFAILFGEVYGIFSLDDADEISYQASLYAIFFIILGIVCGIASFVQTYMFNIAGAKLTTRMRQLTFRNIISQDISWFDDQRHAVGILCARLSGDCASIQGATGTRLGALLQSVATIVVSIAVSLYLSWDLTLIGMISIPLVLGTAWLESLYMARSDKEEKDALVNASRIAVEAISNIRTVASLCQEEYVMQRYCEETDRATSLCRKKVRYRGLVFALSEASPFYAYSVAFYYGGISVANHGLDYKIVIKVSEALIFGALILGNALSNAPNVTLAMTAAARILRLIDRVPKFYNVPPELVNRDLEIEGNVEFKNVDFRYPLRPHIQVLKGLNLEIPKGISIALVGPSGCGKSTCIQLLLRYYDPEDGTIKLDRTPILNIPVELLRSQLGIVSQEPVLFEKTIAENISYGDNSRTVPLYEIIDAAISANMHDFVKTLPLGYETMLGTKGTQLSGGQKQRIAIARAVVRNPKILLLDEATSSLDTYSEHIVQAALDSIKTGRTSITIAHRLSTIQNVDMICVIKDGVIVEKGTHTELIELDKEYAQLYFMQDTL